MGRCERVWEYLLNKPEQRKKKHLDGVKNILENFQQVDSIF